jgi:hypothetical protein
MKARLEPRINLVGRAPLDAHRQTLRDRFVASVNPDPDVTPPGGSDRKFTAVAAE